MSATPQDVEKVALLARLAISESDLPEVTERFSRVLNLVDELNTIDTESVTPMSNPHDMEQRLRPDIVTRDDNRKALWLSACTRARLFSGTEGNRLMAENALLTAPVSNLKQLLLDRTVSSEELTKAYLAQIAAENTSLNAVVTVCAEEALASARDADAQIARGTTRSLTGIPLLHKDIFCTEGVRTTCGSRMLESFVPPMTPPWSPK